MRIAITGGTGFVGSNLIRMALAGGHEVRALTRRPQTDAPDLHWIEGALDRPDILAELAAKCDAVIHVAGVINGTPEAFRRGNVDGTDAMVAAAAQAGVTRFIHISSLAAREPELSAYGASKHASEQPVIAGMTAWTIIRPPAIYGPGDRELLELFRIARRGIVPLPPGGHLSVIAVEDLCRLILACLDSDIAIGRTYEPDDGRPGGWGTAQFAQAIGRAVGRRVVALPIPKRVLLWGAAIDRALRRGRAKLTPDRVAYFCHPDWTAAANAHPPTTFWQAQIETEAGLAATACWYRAHGWL